MRVHYFQHGPFESPGIISVWAKQHKLQIMGTRVDLFHPLPIADNLDFLILLGGPCSLRQPNVKQAFKQEIHFLKQMIQLNRPILGICLGAQLIAESLGSETQSSPYTEIGVFPVLVSEEGLQDPVFSRYPTQFDALHLHSDMFSLPKDARLLANSKACPHQAYRLGDRVYGLQYHLEKTTQDMEAIIEMIEMVEGPYVCSLEALKNYQAEQIHPPLISLLDYLLSKV